MPMFPVVTTIFINEMLPDGRVNRHTAGATIKVTEYVRVSSRGVKHKVKGHSRKNHRATWFDLQDQPGHGK